jgi:predicted phage terminase large subunit-like protein
MSAVRWEDLGNDVMDAPDDFIDERDRRRLSAFTARMFPGYTRSDHIDQLVDALEWAVATPGARLLIDLPPRHSKSLHVSENLPAWFLGRNPDKRVIAASHTAQLAYTFSRRVRNKIADPKWPFPGVKIAGDKAAVQAWDIEGHLGGYYAVGVGGSPTGSGGNLIAIDDPIRNQKDADSETVREAIWEWYTGTLRTRLEPGGAIILCATRWHEDDLTGRLIEAEKKGGETWRRVHLPALNDAGEALWPERWPVEALESIRSAVGSRVWQAQYQGDPTPSEGGMFKRHWWKRYTVLPQLTSAELYLDSAFKEGVENDYSALALWGSDGRGDSYLIKAWRARVAFPALIRMCRDAHAWSRAQYPSLSVPLVIEDRASGQSAIQVLGSSESGAAIPVIPYPINGSASKVSRAEAGSGYVEGGRAHVPDHAEWLDDWLTEHERFPLGAHDDWVDTTSMAIDRLGLRYTPSVAATGMAQQSRWH